MVSVVRKITNVIRTLRSHSTQPLRVEFVLSDYCNLNCKGCTHYSPLAPKEFTPLVRLDEAMRRIASLKGRPVPELYLIGGEPLLYPELPEAMEMMRRHFPVATLKLFTNGIALPRMTGGFWGACRDTDFVIAITRYPVKVDYDSIEKLCRDKGVKYEIFGDRSSQGSFFRFGLDPRKKQNMRLSHFKCYNRGCVSIVDNKIFPCSISACVGHLNAACGTKFAHEKGDFIHLDQLTHVDQIRHLRNRPVPFCGYCINPPDVTVYGPSRHEVSEWVNQ